MKRRHFVRNVSMAVPAMLFMPTLLSSCKKDDELGNTDWSGKIIVIGAGASGLYAGHLITQHAPNAQLQILEAGPVRGGRVRELTGFADYAIELGAEEIHGNKTEWYKIATGASNVSLVNNAMADYYVIDNQLSIEDDLANDADFIAGNNFIAQADTYTGADKTVKDHADANNIAQRVRNVVNAQTGNEWGTDYSILSIKGMGEESELWSAGDDGYMLANRSYISIMEEKFAAAWNKVILNTQVKKIDYGNSTIVLTDQNNVTHTCDKLIITVPLAVLKSGDITFSPALPAEKTDAIANIGMGNGMKIILKFSNRFWADDLGSLFGNGTVPEFWYTSLGRGNTPVLTAFIMGTKAATLSAQGNSAIQTVLAELDSFYGNSAATNSFVDGYIMDWAKEPFIKGGYSYPIVGGGITKRQMLAKKLNNSVFFAGEATHTEGHSATVHGAIETGYRAVQEFIDSVN